MTTTGRQLQQRQLDQLYDWVDAYTLSRPKKNISRDFSDAVLMAEIISINCPKLVELHNYPPTNSLKSKMSNWTTLANKVLSKIGIHLSLEDIRRLSNSTPMAVEALLYEVKLFADERTKEREEEDRAFPDPFEAGRGRRQAQNSSASPIPNKLQNSSKVEELREVLALLKQKIALVQHSIERKDAHIRQLEDTLKMYSS